MFKNWKVWVCKNCGLHYYSYGDDTPENCWQGCGSNNFVQIDETRLSPEDYIAITENELEDANWHSITELPSKLYEKIKRLDITDNLKVRLAKIICEEIYDAI